MLVSTVSAPSFRLGDHIAGLADHIGIIPHAAGHRVAAQSTIETVVAGTAAEGIVGAIADQDVVECIARAINNHGAGQREVLHVGSGAHS